VNEKTYIIHLSETFHWAVEGAGGCDGLVERLAQVMRLEEGEPGGLPLILYTDRLPQWTTEWEELNFRWCSFRLDPAGDGAVVLVPPVRDDRTAVAVLWCSLYAIYMRVIAQGGLPIHSALIEHNGNGYLLAGGGGTGKSTACMRLSDGWNALCDDETLIIVESSGRLTAHPFPTWSNFLLNKGTERSWDIRRSVTLKGIYFLQQSRGDKIIPMGRGMGAAAIYESAAAVILRSSDNLAAEELARNREALFRNAVNVASRVPCYTLEFSLNGRFWENIGSEEV